MIGSFGSKAQQTQSATTVGAVAPQALDSHSSIKIAGAFLLVVTAVILTLGVEGAATGSPHPAALNSQSQANQGDASQAEDTPPSDSSPGHNAASNVTHSTSTTTTTDSNGTTTQMTVDGQSIPVPANGTTQKTITSPDGQTTVQVSNSQSNTGSTSNSSISQVSNFSNSVTQEVTMH